MKNLQDFLLLAVSQGCADEVEHLLKEGANPNTENKNGITALLISALKGYEKFVEILLEKGANPNTENKDGITVLQVAIKEGHIAIVRSLLEKGANPNTENKDGITALMVAALTGHTEIVEVLLEKGANPNTENKDGTTALIAAAEAGHTEIVEVLLEKGANSDTKNNGGITALVLAKKEAHSEIVEILLKKIAIDKIIKPIQEVEQYLGKSGNKTVTLRDFLNQKKPKKLVDYMGNDEITDKLTLLIEKYPLNDNQFFLRQYAQAKQQKFYDNKIQSIDFFKLPGEINSKIGYYLTEKEDKVSLLVACTKKAKIAEDCSTFPAGDTPWVDSGTQTGGTIAVHSWWSLLVRSTLAFRLGGLY